jgi:transposase
LNVPLDDGQQTQDFAAILQRLQTLETTVLTLHDTVEQLRAENAELRETVAKQDAIIRKYQAMLFGTKSEQGTPASAAPPAKDAPAPAMPPDETPTTPAPKRPRGQRRGAPGHGRRRYEELPPREVIHDLPEDARRCPICGDAYMPAGTEDATTLAWEVTIQRVIHRRQKYQRTCDCHVPVILTAPPPPKLIQKGLLEVSAVANLVVNKFLHGQPINRQLHELALLCGVRFAPGTLVGVQDTVGTLLRPLTDATILHLRASAHWHADETRWLQFGDETKTRWWLWVFASPDAVAFVLDPTRARAVPRRIFGLDDDDARHATGILSCDRWKSYQGLDGLACAYCWAHVRRDFTDLAKGYPATLGAWAAAWVDRIGRLYHLTAQRLLFEPGTDAFRRADRALRDHVAAIAHVRATESADRRLLQDARHALDSLARHWDGLILFLDHPGVPLDNNEAERLLRTSVVGRKNFYGSGSLNSGQLAECAYTVLLTAARNGLNPLTYLRAYLDACAHHGGTAPADLNRFLPWTVSPADRAAWTLPPTAA